MTAPTKVVEIRARVGRARKGYVIMTDTVELWKLLAVVEAAQALLDSPKQALDEERRALRKALAALAKGG